MPTVALKSRPQQLAEEIGLSTLRLLPRTQPSRVPVSKRPKSEKKPQAPKRDTESELAEIQHEINLLLKLKALREQKAALELQLAETSFSAGLGSYDALTEIARQAVAGTGVTIDAIKSRSRFPQVCSARWRFFALAKAAKFSLNVIGKFVNRDHGTVSHGLKRNHLSATSCSRLPLVGE